MNPSIPSQLLARQSRRYFRIQGPYLLTLSRLLTPLLIPRIHPRNPSKVTPSPELGNDYVVNLSHPLLSKRNASVFILTPFHFRRLAHSTPKIATIIIWWWLNWQILLS